MITAVFRLNKLVILFNLDEEDNIVLIRAFKYIVDFKM